MQAEGDRKMPVLVEAFSVIIRAAAISAKYRGGWPRFRSDVPNATFCSDGELARVGFMTPPDFIAYIELLEARGLQHLDGDRAVDFAVVNMLDEPELLHECDWLEFGETELDDGRRVAACRLAGSDSEELAVPEGWTGPVEMMYLPPEETNARMRLLRRRPNGVEVFEDRTTGKEWYAGRTTDEPIPGEEHCRAFAARRIGRGLRGRHAVCEANPRGLIAGGGDSCIRGCVRKAQHAFPHGEVDRRQATSD